MQSLVGLRCLVHVKSLVLLDREALRNPAQPICSNVASNYEQNFKSIFLNFLPCKKEIIRPILYEYFGLIFLFYSQDHGNSNS
jgi:hypothetical protein